MDMDKRSYSITKLLQSASPAPRHLSHRFNYFLPRIALWLVVVLLLAACGPGQPKVDSTTLATTTARIAQDYAANSNLDQARAAIDALEVANPHQYLLLQAEEAVNANQDPQTTSALVKLAVALRLNSGSVQAYAVQNGIVSVPPTEPPVPTQFVEVEDHAQQICSCHRTQPGGAQRARKAVDEWLIDR